MLFWTRLALATFLFHPLEGLAWSLRRRLFQREGYRFSVRTLPKVALLIIQSVWQAYFGRRVDQRFGAQIAETAVVAPVFILGHYRSGTTHLHELMSLDPRFASPTRFQAYHPRSFLATERWIAKINDLFMLPRRVQEDEIALMNLSGMSPYLDWCFPESTIDYSKYLTFRRADPHEATAWQESLRWYLRALTIRHRRTILLKSPPHTARVALILQVFPDARFVHVRRNPYDVYVSTVRLLQDLDPVFRLRVRREPINLESVLRTYAEMHASLFEEIPQIPAGQFTEIAYEDLETAPMDQLKQVYHALSLGDFEPIAPVFEAYLQSVAGYQKNRHAKIDPLTRQRIAERWATAFERWDYPT